MRLTLFCVLFLLGGLFCTSCNDNNVKDVAVAPVSNIRYEAGNGTLLFYWDNPAMSDLAYTEVSFVNDDGKERKVLTDGTMSQQLVRGFGSGRSYEFKFVTYNTGGVKSEPVSFFANPLEPLMNIFNGKVKITTDFGGVYLDWDNVYDEEFYIDLEYSDINGNNYKEEVLAPGKAVGSKFIAIASNLEGTQTVDISAYICDIYGNESVPRIFKFHKLEAGKFNRSLWKIVDFSSQNSDAPVSNMLDGKASTIWHSQWQGGTSQFPHHASFDLGSKKRIEKAEFQHRQNNVMAKGMEIWGTNTFDESAKDQAKWTFCGSYDMDSKILTPQVLVLPNPVEYRFVKIVFTTPGGNATNASLSEFALYGLDLVE